MRTWKAIVAVGSFFLLLGAAPCLAQQIQFVTNSPLGTPPSAFKTHDTGYCYNLETNNYATNGNYPYGSITFSLVSGTLPPGLRVESLNSNNNGLQRQGAIDDSSAPLGSGCVASSQYPYHGATTAGTYNFTLRACDNIGGSCACSSSDPVNHPNDCTGAHPLTIVVADTVPQPVAALPETFLDTTYNLPTGGTTWTVGCRTSPYLPGYYLQQAFYNANPGDVIVLQHGCTYANTDAIPINGPNQGILVPLKFNPSNKWIYVIPDNLASLPPPGTRICNSPSSCAAIVPNLPTIAENQGSNGLEIVRETNQSTYPACNAQGECASYWRFVGIEIKSTYSGTVSNPCPTRESGSGAQPYQLHNCGSEVLIIPDHNKLGQPIGTNNFTFDRMYVHGSPTQDVVIGFDMDCIACALIDSYVSDIHASNTETQAANAEYTPGPLKIHNNYLAAAGEAFFLGGSGAIYSGGQFYDNPYVTRDVEISNNQIEAQQVWDKCGDGGTVLPGELLANGTACPYPPTLANPSNQWIVKNDLEFKDTQRVLVTGNLIQNSWLSAQTGGSILFEPAGGESGNSTVVQDITLENNIDNNADTCITYAGQDYNCEFAAGGGYPACTNESRTQRINIYNNLCLMNPSHDGGAAHIGIYWTAMAGEAVFNHNTILMSDGSFPGASLDFASQGWGNASPTVNNFDQYNLYHLNNLLGNNPNGDGGIIPYYPVEDMGWYEPDPSTLQNMGRFTGNVLWVPGSCNLGIFGSCEYDWNNGPLTGNNATTSVTYSACGNPSYGNYQLATPNWAANTTDGQQAGVICSVLCATGVCNGNSSLTILSTSPPAGTVGVGYSYSLAASGGNPPYTWSISAGSLPAGLSIVGSAIEGTPTTAGTSSFTLKVTDSSSNTATANLSITIGSSGNLTITSTTPPSGTVGTGYSYPLTASGGTPPYTWSIVSGSLPTGLNLSGNLISGTPAAPGTFSFTVKVTDSASNTATAPMSITINGALLASTTVLTSGENSLYQTQSTTLTATVSVTGSAGAPTGTVNFMLGNTVLGTGTLSMIDGNDSSASMLLHGSQLVLGPNGITAVYAGDNNYAGSTSAPITVTLLSSDNNFGSVNVGTPAPPYTLTYSFKASAQLTAINILTLGAPGLDFTDGGGSTCMVGTLYTSGQNCSVVVAFTPSAPGLRVGSVTLFAQGSNLPLIAEYVSGIGESPAVTIDPGTQTTLGTITNAATYGSAVDGAGNVYVADQANGQVVEIAAGTQQQSVVVNQLSSPTSVALDGAGNLYIAESSGVVMVPNENGTLNPADMTALQIAGLGLAQGIAEDGNGNLYVADNSNGDVIQVPGGFGTPVTLASGLTNPHGVAVDAAGDVYVSSDNQVSEYPVGGGNPIPMGTGYRTPQAVAVDASGTVYVADTGNAQIVKVAPGGQSQSTLTVTGLVAPQGIALDVTGNLYVSDSSSVYEVNRAQAALNFGNVAEGTTSPAQTLTVSNIGNQQLTASGLAISANFSQQPSGGSDCSSTTQLTAGGACALAVAFSPTTLGVVNGTVGLTDNALNNLASQQTVSLTGTGVEQQQQPQTITFPNPGTQTYGVGPITLTATASSGLPVSYTVLSGPALVNGSLLTITGAGSITVQANQAGNGQWLPASPVNDTFTVNPAVLTVTANNFTRPYGQDNPAFTYTMTGFVNGDTQGTATSGAPNLSTSATPTSPLGNYAIVITQGTLTAQNYTFVFVNGTLTIVQASTVITWIPETLILSPGEMLGPAGVLDATVSPNIPGTWRYSVGINGHILQLLPTMGFPVGVYRIIVAFTPQDQTDYATPAPMSQTITVVQ